MRNDGMRQMSKSQLLQTTQYAVLQKVAATRAYARMLRRWWATLAVVAGVSFALGLAAATLVLR